MRNALSLMMSPDAWRFFSARQADPRFKPFEEKVFKRDRYTCQFCGFQAHVFQEVVNIDGSYQNNKLSNLATACSFCSQCFFIESVGVGGFGGGDIIYLPEMTQTELNSLCHVLFCAITNDTGYKSVAQTIYRGLKERTHVVEQKLGEGTSDPAILGHLIIDSGKVKSEITKQIFKDLRLLPSRAKFRKHIEGWATQALEEMAVQKKSTAQAA
jgi:intracellular multiplication protein IcmJ